MGWWKSPSASPSHSSTSSSSAASPSSPSRSSRTDLRFLWTSSKNVFQHPRLAGQRKHRHLSVIAVRNLVGEGGDERKGESAYSMPVSRSPSNLGDVPLTSRSDSSPMLFPLPLPPPSWGEAGSAGGHLPSPREENGTGELSVLMGEKLTASSALGSRLGHVTKHSNPRRFDVPPVLSKRVHYRSMFQYSNSIEEHLSLNIPRSAPTSGLCSPLLSPGRLSNGDNFPSGYLNPEAPRPQSTSEVPSVSVSSFHMQSPVERILASPERSPLHSPTAKSPGIRSRNPSAPSSPLHRKLFPENPSHSGANVHPLPLPPGPSAQLSPPLTPRLATKPDLSSMGNQWQKGKLIGSGTFGSVYIGTNRHTGALCAMKEVNLVPGDTKSAECIKQLHQEIRFLTQLEHQNIVQYYGSEIIEDRFYIYLEYVHPGSINKYVHDHCGAITESVLRNFSRHILKGLAYLHSKNAIHRDIKGANLLVNSNGIVKLSDFGMAKHLMEAKLAYSITGTPYWMAPEVLQASMNKEVGYTSAVDIWSLGCTIIEMFTGKHPWDGLSPAAAMFKVLRETPRIPEILSSEGKDFLGLCFRRNPSERPSAIELLEHPFIKNTHHDVLHGSVQEFTEKKPSDGPHSSNNYSMFKSDSFIEGRNTTNGGTGQAHHDSSVSRHSPRSILEVVPNFSPPLAIQDASCCHFPLRQRA